MALAQGREEATLYSVPAAIARSGRSTRLHLADKAPWAHLVENAITRLRHLADQARPAIAVRADPGRVSPSDLPQDPEPAGTGETETTLGPLSYPDDRIGTPRPTRADLTGP